MPNGGPNIVVISGDDVGVYEPQLLHSARQKAGSTADELSKLAALEAQGVITDSEYEQQKAKLLG